MIYRIAPINYLVDRLSILTVKREKGFDCEKEYQFIKNRVEKSYSLKKAGFKELYRINKEMWPMHNELMESNDVQIISNLARKILLLNGERAVVRSKIAKEFDEFEEYKDYV